MITSIKGIALIKRFEGLKLTPYTCSAGVATIGYGSTFYEDGSEVTLEDASITVQRAEELLKNTLKIFEKSVNDLVKVPINQEMFDALVCFAFNVGLGNLKKSTLLKLLNAKSYFAVPPEFLKWNKAGGKELLGLTRRRQAEMALFNEGLLKF